jgi:hypothetical protein
MVFAALAHPVQRNPGTNIELFSLDALVNVVARAGMQVKLSVRKAA